MLAKTEEATRMDNPQTLATLGTQDTGGRQTKQQQTPSPQTKSSKKNPKNTENQRATPTPQKTDLNPVTRKG